MDMVGHEHVRVHETTGFPRNTSEQAEVEALVTGSEEARRAVVPALRDMDGIAGNEVAGRTS